MKKWLSAFFLVSAALGAQAMQAQTAAPLTGLDAYVQATITQWKVPGLAVAIVKDGKVVIARGYGLREVGKPAKVDADTLFGIASNTKAFTAAALGTLVTHGFVVLSVNYRLGIGYGHAFHNPEHWGPTGVSEYRDVLAGAKYLQKPQGVDPKRIGIWGGSYGGYLTALALARNSSIFKAGVDMRGVHDWSRFIGNWFGKLKPRYEQGDRKQAMEVAWESSPDSVISAWKSPVLLIQGDDDRNVPFHQMVDFVQRLKKHHVPFRKLVFPNEIHGFLRYQSRLEADTATVQFFTTQLHPDASRGETADEHTGNRFI